MNLKTKSLNMKVLVNMRTNRQVRLRQHFKKKILLIFGLIMAVTMALLFSASAHATEITVTTEAELREAIANNDEAIIISIGAPITMKDEAIEIEGNVTLQGAYTISQYYDEYGLFVVREGAVLTLRGGITLCGNNLRGVGNNTPRCRGGVVWVPGGTANMAEGYIYIEVCLE